MGQLSISLEQWIALSSLYEANSIQPDAILSSPYRDNRTLDDADPLQQQLLDDVRLRNAAQLKYIERAAKAALFLLDFLNADRDEESHVQANQSCTIEAEDISLGYFSVNITLEDEITSDDHFTRAFIADEGSPDDVPANYDHLSERHLKSIANGITSFDFAPSVENKCIRKERMQSDEVFRRVGLLLCRLFCRGKTPLYNVEPEDRAFCNSDAFKRTYNSGEGEDDKQTGDKEGGHGQTLRGVRKLLREMHISNEDELLLTSNVPASICRLTTDLIRSVNGIENKFESLDDVIAELKAIIQEPEIFLYDIDASKIGELDFGNKIFGRGGELVSLLQAAARVPLGGDAMVNNLVLIGGHSGSGKSYLVNSVERPLAGSGWISISCKFDRMMQYDNLSTISSAFENFFASLVAINRREIRNGNDGDNAHFRDNIVSSIEQSLPASAIVLLSELMPSLGRLFPGVLRRVVSDSDLSVLGNEGEFNGTSQGNLDQEHSDEALSNAAIYKIRIRYLFRRLLHAISSPERPFLFFFDDLQWADSTSLDLLNSLVMDFDHLQQFDDGVEHSAQCVLFVGAYRNNEVDESHILAIFSKELASSDAVHVTNIHLNGMTRVGTNAMISEVLRLPVRLTKSLTNVIEAKTLGNPLFVKTFMKMLIEEKILRYSLLEKRWMWNIEDVKTASIDENVAELLTRKLMRLPRNIQEALKVTSCFGSYVDEMTLQLLYSSDERRKFMDYLKCAIVENILEKHGNTYKFVHDILQQATYELMPKEERAEQHYRIGMQLISNTLSSSFGPHFVRAQFSAIDQINKAKVLGFTDPSIQTNTSFADMNLKAGERSMELSDFISGMAYIEFGISFLPDRRWESNYELSLRLYDNACLACYINALPKKLTMYVSSIMENAVNYSDTLKCSIVVIKALGGAGKAVEACEKAFLILRELGEDFPSNVTPDLIHTELASTRTLLMSSSKEKIVSAPRMTNTNKRWAMRLLHVSQPYLFITKPNYLPLVACRMLTISAKHGYCVESATGLLGYSYTQLTFLLDIEEGYRWGKISLSLLECFNTKDMDAMMKSVFYSVFGYWGEPLQATSTMLLETHAEAMMAGHVDSAMMCAFMYCRQRFMCGDNLSAAEKHCEVYALRMLKVKQLQHIYALSSHHHMLLKLMGSEKNPFGMLDEAIQNEDDLLGYTISNGKSSDTQSIYFDRLLISFWFKKYEEAADMAEKYRSRVALRFTDVYHAFYEGLTAFHLARCSSDEAKWMEIGENALSKFRTWATQSKWNFENKLLLLEAEWHFSRKECKDATTKYGASIKSAQLHCFLHEEGLAMEKLGTFYKEHGDATGAAEEFARARDCYEKWGAFALVNLLDKTHQ